MPSTQDKVRLSNPYEKYIIHGQDGELKHRLRYW